MTIVVYPAVLSHEAPGLKARFPDFTGVEVEAGTSAELIRLAREALGGELQKLEGAGETWPEPTPLESLNTTAAGSVLLVDVSVEDTPVRLTVSIGERLLKRIDEDAAAKSMTRSGYLALGARRLLGESPSAFGGAGGDTGRKIQEEMEAVGRRINEALGPNSSFGRTVGDLDALALEGLRRLGQEVRSAMKPRTPRPGPADAGPPQDETSVGG